MSATMTSQHDLDRSDLLRWSVRRAADHRAALLAVLIATMLVVLVELVKPWPLKVLVDNGISGEPLSPATQRIADLLPGAGTQDGLIAWSAAATVVIFAIGWSAATLAAVSAVVLSQRMTYALAADVYDHLQQMSPAMRGQRRTGDLVRRVTGDTGSLAAIVVSALIPALTAVLSVTATLVVMWNLNRPLTLLTLAVVPLLGLTIWSFAGRMERAGADVGAAYGDLYTAVEERLSAVPAIQAFAREPDADLAVWRAGESTLTATMTATRAQVDFKIVVGTAGAIGTAGVLLVGGWQAMTGSVSVGTLLVFIAYVAAFYTPLAALTYSSATVLQATAGARRVHELLSQPPLVADAPGAQSMPAIAGAIEFRGVTAGYDPGIPVLNDLDLTIAAGELVTLAGRSGIGKSTLVSLLPRFLDPWEGSVCIDGIDLRAVTLASLRTQIGIVPQDAALLPVSIAENIAFGCPEATADEIQGAARLAQADQFIAELPDGYQAVVGERGATLSGGQRQRIAIARALLLDPPVLILDEPASALDSATEERLMQALREVRAGKTTILITHRPRTSGFATRAITLG